MTILLQQPPSPLQQHIEALWYVDLQVPYTREKILPGHNIELMINFGSPFRKYHNQDETQFALKEHSWIAGMHTQYIINEPVAETHMIGVRFKPGGAFSFFDIPLVEIRDLVLDMTHLWGNLIAEWRERLLAFNSPQGRLKLLSSLLLQQYHAKSTQNGLIRAAIQRLNYGDKTLSIRSLSDDLGVSHKHLNAQFKRQVGMTPKQFARVTKFQQVINAVDPRAPINWGELAFRCHYYDQAHFNHDFQAFCGLSPTEYVAQRARYFGDLEPGEAVNFVPIG